ncbi:hypothetical protein CTheo_7991 [Ceratobasidium theobromae]|uniref:Uncharacterized protein n=1 Tax=Ceratobasidium theobromae TaxID=1582974 RepID=A0A5N5QAY4_9AGAM|nr:hypothetical protein CTheo_7991 [Ceratobasidium theobromae]
MISSCTEFFAYVQTIIPHSADKSQVKVASMLMHYITLVRATKDQLDLKRVLSASGKPFVGKVMRNQGLVHKFALALGLKMHVPWKPTQIPGWLKEMSEDCKLDVKASLACNKTIEKTCDELYVLTAFVCMARQAMITTHEATLRALDREYSSHCHLDYKPAGFLGLGARSTRMQGLKASQIPQALISYPTTVKSQPIPISNGRLAPMAIGLNTSKSSVSSHAKTSGIKSQKITMTTLNVSHNPPQYAHFMAVSAHQGHATGSTPAVYH